MAAATENAARYTDYWGKTPVEVIDVTWGNADTIDSQFGSVLKAEFAPTTNSAPGVTISGKTVTLVSGGSLTGKLTIWGNGE